MGDDHLHQAISGMSRTIDIDIHDGLMGYLDETMRNPLVKAYYSLIWCTGVPNVPCFHVPRCPS